MASQIGGVLDIVVKNLADLTDQTIEDWRRFQKDDPTLNSPFYAPDFAYAVDKSDQPVQVALIFDADKLTGILPFHKGRMGTGVPVGGQINDYQGIIGPAQDQLDPSFLLKSCGLKSYDFNHLPISQLSLAKGKFTQSFSPCINIKDGFEPYIAERRSKKNKVLKNAVRNLRILERDIGPVRLELNDNNDDAWETLVRWKNQSLEQLGVTSILNVDWARQTFEHIRNTSNPYFAGMVSTLYVDEKIAAVHFGMRSEKNLHWWFPTYDQSLSKYSPGIVLLLEVTKRLPDLGLVKLDLGRGAQPYKKAFANGQTDLCEGSIETIKSFAGVSRRLRKAIDKSMNGIPRLAKPVQFQRRAFNRLLGAVYLPK